MGPLATVHNAPTVLKQPWTREELRLAIKLLKLKKTTGRNWPDSRATEGGSRNHFWLRHFQLSILFSSPGAFLTCGTYHLQNVAEKTAGHHTTDFKPIASS